MDIEQVTGQSVTAPTWRKQSGLYPLQIEFALSLSYGPWLQEISPGIKTAV
jgi:hypothetical protein